MKTKILYILEMQITEDVIAYEDVMVEEDAQVFIIDYIEHNNNNTIVI